jgi:cytochrome c5
MPRRVRLLIAAYFILPAFACSASPQDKAPANTSAVKPPAKATHNVKVHDDGQRVFDQNCSRCHTTPDGFPPRISGTVARHMRVRASLSAADEKALLHFLNP